VNGDLTTAQILIEDGAYFKGSIEIEKSVEKESDKNVFSRTASASAMSAAGAGPGVSKTTKEHLGSYSSDRTTSGSLSPAAPASSLERRGTCSLLFYAAR